MARIIYKRNRIDPTKISGPYSLLAVMLLVAEILFAIWLCKAESSIERSIAGLVMAIFFVCLMLIVLKMNRTLDQRKNANIANGQIAKNWIVERIFVSVISGVNIG